MTGGFYDHRRSKLRFMSTIKQNTVSINLKERELEEVRYKLQDILTGFLYVLTLSITLFTLLRYSFRSLLILFLKVIP